MNGRKTNHRRQGGHLGKCFVWRIVAFFELLSSSRATTSSNSRTRALSSFLGPAVGNSWCCRGRRLLSSHSFFFSGSRLARNYPHPYVGLSLSSFSTESKSTNNPNSPSNHHHTPTTTTTTMVKRNDDDDKTTTNHEESAVSNNTKQQQQQQDTTQGQALASSNVDDIAQALQQVQLDDDTSPNRSQEEDSLVVPKAKDHDQHESSPLVHTLPKTTPVPSSSSSLQTFASWISQGDISNVLVVTGAGISVSAGIPDFRTPGTGM